MERIKIIFVFLLLGFVIHAQESSKTDISSDTLQLLLSDSIQGKHLSPISASMPIYKPKPYHLEMQVSTSVTTDFDGGFGTNLYVTPQLWYIPNHKWQLSITPILGRNTFYDMPVWIYPGYLSILDGSATNLGLYTQGSYNLNEKLYVGATIHAEALLFDQKDIRSTMPDFNNIGTSAFIGYKFSEHFSVEAEFGVNKNPYYNTGSWQSPVSPFIIPRTRNPYNR